MRAREEILLMSWLRDEIWFDVDVTWTGEVVGASQGGVSALQLPLFRRLASEALEPVHAPNGLSASRQRRAERRRRRNARRARAAALVVAPAAVLPLAGQKVGLGGSGSGALQQDPPSLVGGTLPGLPTSDVSAPRAAGAASGSAAGQKTSSQTDVPRIHWHRATSHGLPYGGSLSSGTQLPVEGPDWVTWNPVEDSVPNAPGRLYGHERTIRRLTAVLEAFRAANPHAARVVVGDLSFRGGGRMEQHVSHQNGLDVDVYYPRVDRRLRAPRARSQVDLELSQDLVDRFVAAGARFVFVGYSTGLRGPSRVVEPYPNHEDHMHVRFPPPPG